MVNYQTSLYEMLNFFLYLYRLGIFLYVRDILQVTVSLDHPVYVILIIRRRTPPPFFLEL